MRVTKKMMSARLLAVSTAGLSAMMASAAAQQFNFACVKGGDERTIAIVSPGEVGAACDVRYAQLGTTRTPYHANNSSSFCQTKAQEIVDSLIADGYACGAGGPLTAEVRQEPQPAPAVAAVSETVAAAEPEPLVEQPAVATTPAETITEAAPQQQGAVEPVSEITAALETVAGEAPEFAPETEEVSVISASDVFAGAAKPKPEASVAAAETPSPVEASYAEEPAATTEPATIETAELDSLPEPEPTTVATRGPASLAGERLEELQRAATPIPAGRLVGAEPDAPKIENDLVQERLASAAPAEPSQTTTPAVEPVQAAAPAPKPATKKKKSKLRDPQEIILATLNAQTAAWNEGNLPAFMEIYWKDDSLKFVSGTTVSRGWSATMKRYRERYADDSGLGKLSFEKTDVEMVTDEVAIVTGRFNHAKGEETSSGAFSLVMKQVNGVWRIVHDHSVADPATN